MAACTCADPTAVKTAVEQAGSKTESAINNSAQKLDETLYGASLGGSHGAIGPLRWCHSLGNQVGAAGKSAWTMLFQAATIAIAIANAVAQETIHSKKMDLAEGYYDQAEYKWGRFRDKYMPLEKQLLREVSTQPMRSLNCADDQDRARQSVFPAYELAMKYLSDKAKANRLCLDDTLVGLFNTRQSMAFVDTTNYNMQDDQFYTDYSNDKRWNRRSNLLNLGRGLSSEALRYGDVARTLLDNVSGQVSTAANSLLQSLGYYSNRRDTIYPNTTLSMMSGRSMFTLTEPYQFALADGSSVEVTDAEASIMR